MLKESQVCTSSETQGQIVGTTERLNRRKNMAQKKIKEQPEEPLGTMSYQTSSKRSLPFWLLIGARKLGHDPFNQNSNRSDRENWSTSKGGPVFSKLFQLDRNFRKFWLNGSSPLCFSGTNQKPGRRRPFGTGLVRHCPQRLFLPFFTFLCALLFRSFRLSLAPTICPWVSEDEVGMFKTWNGEMDFLNRKNNWLLLSCWFPVITSFAFFEPAKLCSAYKKPDKFAYHCAINFTLQ